MPAPGSCINMSTNMSAALSASSADLTARQSCRSVRSPASPEAGNWQLRHLGLVPYEPIWRSMQAFTDRRRADTPDEIWLLQHEPVFTLGQAGKREHVLAPGDIPVLPVDRGGQVTYHGPGQLVLYPLLDLKRLQLGVRELVCLLEQALIGTLAHFGIQGSRRPGAPGVYAGEAKIAALGLRVRRGCSFHGLAFNVDLDLEPFDRINPCGYQGLAVTRLIDHCPGATMAAAEAQLVAQLAALLGFTWPPQTATGTGIQHD